LEGEGFDLVCERQEDGGDWEFGEGDEGLGGVVERIPERDEDVFVDLGEAFGLPERFIEATFGGFELEVGLGLLI